MTPTNSATFSDIYKLVRVTGLQYAVSLQKGTILMCYREFCYNAVVGSCENSLCSKAPNKVMVRSETFGPSSNLTSPHRSLKPPTRVTQSAFTCTSNNVIASSCHEIRVIVELTVCVCILGYKGHECIHGLWSYQWINVPHLFLHVSTVMNFMWSTSFRPAVAQIRQCCHVISSRYT